MNWFWYFLPIGIYLAFEFFNGIYEGFMEARYGLVPSHRVTILPPEFVHNGEAIGNAESRPRPRIVHDVIEGRKL